MRIDDFSYFLMLDGNDDELVLTKAIFHLVYPGIPFRCERDPTRAMAHLCGAISAGARPTKICVLLDIRMPRTNGFELLYKLRNEIATYECCVLMLSASRVVEDRTHSSAIGADGFVSKPFKLVNLERALALLPGPSDGALLQADEPLASISQ